MPRVMSVVSGVDSELRSEIAELCEHYLASEDEQGLLRALRDHKAALARLPSAKRSDSMYQFSVLLKRVEKTCGKHFCGLWNEVRILVNFA